MLAALAEGTSEIRNYAASQDCRSTLRCLRGLGAEVLESGRSVILTGRGLHGLSEPTGMLDAGNSGTTMRLLSGILAGQAFESVIGGDESLSRRPMARVAQPLRLMGAAVETREGDLPPLKICGGRLRSLRYSLPVASAQVKSCVLLAGLYADGTTGVREGIPTRNHTEIALKHFGASIREAGGWIEIDPGPRLRAAEVEVPGDLSGAAFFLVAAALTPGSEILIPQVGLNRRRRELLDYLQAAGLDIVIEREREAAGEARGNLRVRYTSGLLGGKLPPIEGALTASLIDEIPVLSVLGSQVAGGLVVSDARELRVKESDRIAALASNLISMGASVEEKPDGLILNGGQILRGADIDARGDHRIAMALAIAGIAAEGETRIHGAECADVSFPGFWDTLAQVAGL